MYPSVLNREQMEVWNHVYNNSINQSPFTVH